MKPKITFVTRNDLLFGNPLWKEAVCISFGSIVSQRKCWKHHHSTADPRIGFMRSRYLCFTCDLSWSTCVNTLSVVCQTHSGDYVFYTRCFLVANATKETWMLASKLNALPSFVAWGSGEDSSRTQTDAPARSFDRPVVRPMKAFSSYAKIWTAWKASTRAGLGLIGLL